MRIGEVIFSDIEREVKEKTRRLYRFNRTLPRFGRVIASLTSDSRNLVLDACLLAVTACDTPDAYAKDPEFVAMFMELQDAQGLVLLAEDDFQEFLRTSRDT
jgi:hypothetical protein